MNDHRIKPLKMTGALSGDNLSVQNQAIFMTVCKSGVLFKAATSAELLQCK